jgi:hypothetical protein
MKKNLVLCVTTVLWLHAFGQMNSGTTVDLVPDYNGSSEDARVFYYYVSLSGMMPYPERKNEFQKSRLGEKEVRPSLWRGEVQMGMFLPRKKNRMLEPNASVRIDCLPTHYMSSSIGLGFVFRPLDLGAGVYYGQYYRQVASEGNFVTRRSRQFDNYSMRGFYLEMANKQASFYFGATIEEKRTTLSTRIAGRVGNILELGRDTGPLRSLEVVLESREFSGPGAGLSTEVLSRFRLQALWVAPTKSDRNEQSRLGNAISHGVLFSLSAYVN